MAEKDCGEYSFGSDGCMLIEKTVKGSVVFIQKWVEKLRRVGD